jgi:hypothetical protein
MTRTAQPPNSPGHSKRVCSICGKPSVEDDLWRLYRQDSSGRTGEKETRGERPVEPQLPLPRESVEATRN